MADKKYVVINRGPRTFDLKDGPNGQKRALLPGHSIECLDEAEYKGLMNYFREVADVDKIVPSNAKYVEELKSQNEKLAAENARLTKEENEPEPEPVAHKEKDTKHKKETKRGK